MSSNYPVNNIPNPGGNDILCGRGGGTNAHPGNIKFRKLVAAHKLRYLAASKSDKPGVARDVVREWRSMDPPGRFLAKMDAKNVPQQHHSNDDDDKPTYWYDVGDKKAREKASQCLRERNGAANEAVAALVKTVTASGEACPEDYATLMNKAALVKAQNDLTIQQQNEMIKMGQHQVNHHQQQQMMRGNNQMGGGNHMNQSSGGGGGMGSNQYCQDTFEPISLSHQNQYNNQGGGRGNDYSPDNYTSQGTTSAEDDMIEAEIQRLLKQRQQQLANQQQRNSPLGGSNRSGGGMGGMSSMNRSGSGGGGLSNSNRSGGGGGGGNSIPQGAYMGEESILREYEQLMQKQRELNMMAGKMNGMGSGMGNGGMGNGMNSGMGSNMGNNGMGNNMGGMMNNQGGMFNNGNDMTSMGGNMGGMNNMGMSNNMGGGMSSMGMHNNGMGSNNYGGGMSNNGPMGGGGGGGGMQSHNPDAAKDYMSRLRSMRQGGGGGGGGGMGSNNMPDQPTSSSGGGYGGNMYGNGMNNNMGNNMGGNSGMGNSNNMMNNMGNNNMMMQQQMMQGGGNNKSGRQEEFTVDEYQKSLQQFLSHTDGYGGNNSQQADNNRMLSSMTQHANNLSHNQQQQQQQYGSMMPGTMGSIQVQTNFGDSDGNKRGRRGSLRSVDDMDLPIGRNTFKSVDSADRPSFASTTMDDLDIRGTFKSVDTMDLMSIGNSINEIMEDDMKNNPEMRKKYGRRLSTGSRAKPGLNDMAHLPGQTLSVKTMDHGQGKKKTKGQGQIDPRLVAQAGTRHSVQTKGCDGPSTAIRGSQLSMRDSLFDGVDDGRMSFGNMSIMSELTDFQDMLAGKDNDAFKDF